MADQKKQEQEKKLKELAEKTTNPEIKQSIKEKQAGLNKPFNK